MRWQTRLKTVGAVLSAIFTATSVVFIARDISPSVHWPYFALGGFIVFAGLMTWMLWDANSQLASRRPKIGLGESIAASTKEGKKEVIISLRPAFSNKGQDPAYQFCLHWGYAPAEYPEKFKPMPDLTHNSPIYQTPDFGPLLELQEPFVILKGGFRGVRTKEILMYCGIEYSDTPSGGHRYNTEWWFVYPLDSPAFGGANEEQIKSLEPHVRKVFGKKRKSTV